MSKKLERLLASKASIEKKIAAERTRLLKIKLPKLVKAFRNLNDYENDRWADCIQSMIDTPENVSAIGIYPIEKLGRFCAQHDIPIEFDWEHREFQSNLLTRIYLRPY